VLRQHLLSGGTSNPTAAKIRAGNVWSRKFDRRRSKIINIALNRGFSSYRTGAPNQVDSAMIDELAALTPSGAIAKLGIGPSTLKLAGLARMSHVLSCRRISCGYPLIGKAERLIRLSFD
jgi:hypothetical protein